MIKPQISRIELTASEEETRMRCQKGVEMEKEIGREWSRRQKKCCAFGRQGRGVIASNDRKKN